MPLLSTVSACIVKLSVASDSTTQGNVQSQNAFVVCVCSPRGDGLPSGQAALRQENTWLRKATISYRAVTGRAYLCGMFLSHANHDESTFFIRSLVCFVMEKHLCIHERPQQCCLSLDSQEQPSPVSGGAISYLSTLSFGL